MSTCSNATFSLQQFWRPDFLRRYVDSLPKKDDMTIIYRIHQFINYAKFMKKTLLLFLFAAFLLNAGQAQNCVRDSSLLITGALLSPAPYTPDSPFYNLRPACLGQPYNQSVTVFVPAQFSGFNIDSVAVAPTGAISNLPTGVSYVCDPPSCRFRPLTLGCIRLTGTVAASNSTDTADLGITASIFALGFPTALTSITFPGQVAPGSHYYLPKLPAAHPQCLSSAADLTGPISGVRLMPNPVAYTARIEIESLRSDDFLFEVFDLVGQRLYFEPIRLMEGANQFTFNAGDLPNGAYFYSISNPSGKVVRKMIVQK
ncbi:MAG: hypothetical protein RL742_1871 [Bacteroidota bacterium]|jgi:hypothetical protein